MARISLKDGIRMESHCVATHCDWLIYSVHVCAVNEKTAVPFEGLASPR